MKYYAIQWWCQVQLGSGVDPSIEYRRHFDTIRHQLPQSMMELIDANILHDTRLYKMSIDFHADCVDLYLNRRVAASQIHLNYRGVRFIESTANPEVGLGGPYGYGDLGYDEIDVLQNNIIEHRLLFSSGIELTISFQHFEWHRT